MTRATSIDLHMHSIASDGVLEPAALVAHARRCGVDCMALTDHDTTDGLADAAAAARRLAMGFVPGIEISADWRGRSVHVLGLAIDPAAATIRDGVAVLAAERRRRAAEIARRLDAAGAPGTEILDRLGETAGPPTRTHFARALAEAGMVRSLSEAFERYLGRGRPAAVASRWPDLPAAVSWILAAGGVAVLAHPLRYMLSGGGRRELAAAFRSAGGAGIEVVCGGSSAAQVEQAVSLAQRTGLAGSVGSDFHDPRVPWNPPGRLAKLPGRVPAIWDGPAPALPLPEPA